MSIVGLAMVPTEPIRMIEQDNTVRSCLLNGERIVYLSTTQFSIQVECGRNHQYRSLVQLKGDLLRAWFHFRAACIAYPDHNKRLLMSSGARGKVLAREKGTQ